MLESAADANGNVDFRFYRFPGSPYLTVLGQPLLIHHRPGAGKGPSNGIGKFLDQRNIIGFLDSPSN